MRGWWIVLMGPYPRVRRLLVPYGTRTMQHACMLVIGTFALAHPQRNTRTMGPLLLACLLALLGSSAAGDTAHLIVHKVKH